MLNMVSLFSGIGAFERALDNIRIEYNLLNYCEIEKEQSRAYSIIHNISEEKNLWDVTQACPGYSCEVDLLTYGFPCQPFSNIGKRLGFNDSKKGNLFYESLRIINKIKPKYLIAENVLGLVTIEGGHTLKTIIKELKNVGYTSYYRVLNSCDYGVPHDRNRLFIVSIRDDLNINEFIWPDTIGCNIYVEDILYKGKPYREMKKSLRPYNNKKYFKVNYYSERGVKKLFDGTKEGFFGSSYRSSRIYSIKGVCPTLTTKNDLNFYELGGPLNPYELFKLQGFNYSDVENLENHVSCSKLCEMAGNSITVDVVEYIYRSLFLGSYKPKQKRLF